MLGGHAKPDITPDTKTHVRGNTGKLYIEEEVEQQ